MEPLTLYARKERSIEGHATTKDKDVTLWRVMRPSDFPNATKKLIQEGPRLDDGTALFPVARYPYYASGKPDRRNKSVMHNCYRYKLEWID
jgi:hypothetical protein